MKPCFTFNLLSKISLSLILLSACSTPEEIQTRKCTKALKHFEKVSFEQGCTWSGLDSSTSHKTTIILKDTTIYITISGDTVKKSIFPLAGKRSILNTKYATSMAWIENDSLKHILTQLQTEIPKIVPGAIKYETIIKEKNIWVPYLNEKQIKNDLKWIHKTLLVSGIILWIAIITWVIIRLRKLFST